MKKREPKNKKDITGKKFGRLTAKEIIYKKPRYWWVCKCDCGNEKLATLHQLERGTTKSCGCYRKEFKNKVKAGEKYNKLKVISKTGKRSASGSVEWLCKCDCGQFKIANASSLFNGYVKSCGCLATLNSVKTKIEKRNERFTKLIGKKVREFTVLDVSISESNDQVLILCECSCGKRFSINDNQFRKRRSCGHLRAGEHHWNYNHELTDEERKKDRYTYLPGIKNWVKEVYRRDGWRCVLCSHKDTGRKGEGIVAHHLNSFRGHEDQSTDLDNGVTLCESCHHSFHREFGYGNNTKEQFEKFRSRLMV